MNQKDYSLIFAMIMAAVLITAGILLTRCETKEQWCENLGEETGRTTSYGGECLIEIAPSLFVPVDKLPYHLDSVRPRRGD